MAVGLAIQGMPQQGAGGAPAAAHRVDAAMQQAAAGGLAPLVMYATAQLASTQATLKQAITVIERQEKQLDSKDRENKSLKAEQTVLKTEVAGNADAIVDLAAEESKTLKQIKRGSLYSFIGACILGVITEIAAYKHFISRSSADRLQKKASITGAMAFGSGVTAALLDRKDKSEITARAEHLSALAGSTRRADRASPAGSTSWSLKHLFLANLYLLFHDRFKRS